MFESLYVAAELYANHGLVLADFAEVNNQKQGEFSAMADKSISTFMYDDPAAMRDWSSVVTVETAEQFSRTQNHALFGLPQFAEVKAYVEKHIQQWTGEQNITLIRSWYLQHEHGSGIDKHHHHYPSLERTVSGVFYVFGDSNPLCISPNFEDVLKIENAPGQLILFDGWVRHWLEPYQHTTPRVSISFDYRINEQPMCACATTAKCFKCFSRKVDIKKHFAENTYFKGHTLDYVVK